MAEGAVLNLGGRKVLGKRRIKEEASSFIIHWNLSLTSRTIRWLVDWLIDACHPPQEQCPFVASDSYCLILQFIAVMSNYRHSSPFGTEIGHGYYGIYVCEHACVLVCVVFLFLHWSASLILALFVCLWVLNAWMHSCICVCWDKLVFSLTACVCKWVWKAM